MNFLSKVQNKYKVTQDIQGSSNFSEEMVHLSFKRTSDLEKTLINLSRNKKNNGVKFYPDGDQIEVSVKKDARMGNISGGYEPLWSWLRAKFKGKLIHSSY